MRYKTTITMKGDEKLKPQKKKTKTIRHSKSMSEGMITRRVYEARPLKEKQ